MLANRRERSPLSERDKSVAAVISDDDHDGVGDGNEKLFELRKRMMECIADVANAKSLPLGLACRLTKRIYDFVREQDVMFAGFLDRLDRLHLLIDDIGVRYREHVTRLEESVERIIAENNMAGNGMRWQRRIDELEARFDSRLIQSEKHTDQQLNNLNDSTNSKFSRWTTRNDSRVERLERQIERLADAIEERQVQPFVALKRRALVDTRGSSRKRLRTEGSCRNSDRPIAASRSPDSSPLRAAEIDTIVPVLLPKADAQAGKDRERSTQQEYGFAVDARQLGKGEAGSQKNVHHGSVDEDETHDMSTKKIVSHSKQMDDECLKQPKVSAPTLVTRTAISLEMSSRTGNCVEKGWLDGGNPRLAAVSTETNKHIVDGFEQPQERVQHTDENNHVNAQRNNAPRSTTALTVERTMKRIEEDGEMPKVSSEANQVSKSTQNRLEKTQKNRRLHPVFDASQRCSDGKAFEQPAMQLVSHRASIEHIENSERHISTPTKSSNDGHDVHQPSNIEEVVIDGSHTNSPPTSSLLRNKSTVSPNLASTSGGAVDQQSIENASQEVQQLGIPTRSRNRPIDCGVPQSPNKSPVAALTNMRQKFESPRVQRPTGIAHFSPNPLNKKTDDIVTPTPVASGFPPISCNSKSTDARVEPNKMHEDYGASEMDTPVKNGQFAHSHVAVADKSDNPKSASQRPCTAPAFSHSPGSKKKDESSTAGTESKKKMDTVQQPKDSDTKPDPPSSNVPFFRSNVSDRSESAKSVPNGANTDAQIVARVPDSKAINKLPCLSDLKKTNPAAKLQGENATTHVNESLPPGNVGNSNNTGAHNESKHVKVQPPQSQKEHSSSSMTDAKHVVADSPTLKTMVQDAVAVVGDLSPVPQKTTSSAMETKQSAVSEECTQKSAKTANPAPKKVPFARPRHNRVDGPSPRSTTWLQNGDRVGIMSPRAAQLPRQPCYGDVVQRSQEQRQEGRRRYAPPVPCERCRSEKRSQLMRQGGYVNELVFERFCQAPGACFPFIHADETVDNGDKYMQLSFTKTATRSPSCKDDRQGTNSALRELPPTLPPPQDRKKTVDLRQILKRRQEAAPKDKSHGSPPALAATHFKRPHEEREPSRQPEHRSDDEWRVDDGGQSPVENGHKESIWSGRRDWMDGRMQDDARYDDRRWQRDRGYYYSDHHHHRPTRGSSYRYRGQRKPWRGARR